MRSKREGQNSPLPIGEAGGGYEATASGQSIYTEAENLDELKKAIKDAVKCYFEEDKVPKIVRLHFVKDEVVAV